MQLFTLVQSFVFKTEMFVANVKQKMNLGISQVEFNLVSCRDVTIRDFGAMIIDREINSVSILLWLSYMWGCGLCHTPTKVKLNLRYEFLYASRCCDTFEYFISFVL